MNRVKLEKTPLNEQVFDLLHGYIEKGTWKCGDKIPSELDLSDTLGVSRITVRQALQKLITMGFLEIKPGKGTYVCIPDTLAMVSPIINTAVSCSDDLMEEMQEFRMMIDSYSASVAAVKRNEEELEELKSIFKRLMVYAEKDDGEAFATADLDYHMMIVRMTHNNIMLSTYETLYDSLHKQFDDLVRLTGYQNGLDFHERITDAIEQRDAILARALMEEHIHRNIESIENARKAE